jgi:hypothetical protein
VKKSTGANNVFGQWPVDIKIFSKFTKQSFSLMDDTYFTSGHMAKHKTLAVMASTGDTVHADNFGGRG